MKLATGYICLICFILLAVKYPLRRLGLHKQNNALMRIHEHASGLLFVSAVVHGILVFATQTERTAALLLSGAASFAVLVWLVAACHMMKDRKKRMDWHRWLSLAACIVIAVHMAAFWMK